MTSKQKIAVDQFVETYMRKESIPGLSISLLQDGESHICSYGYANKAKKRPVSQNTLFEIGSLSKAFTLLGVLLLEHLGKIQMEDDIHKYIPWLHFQPAIANQPIGPITIKDLLYHTSGIPFSTISSIPEDSSDSAIEKAVKAACGCKLAYEPGQGSEYASMNTNILAHVIECASGMPYASYMKNHIFIPLGLYHTYAGYNAIEEGSCLAAGYKYSFFAPRRYKSPRYDGNTPSAFILSCAADMDRWIRVQLGLADIDEPLRHCVAKSHEPQYALDHEPGFSLGAGWNIYKDHMYLRYLGRNPNYSSIILFDKRMQYGICIMSNVPTNTVFYLAENMLAAESPHLMPASSIDYFQRADRVFSYVALIFGGSIVVQGAVLLSDLLQKRIIQLHVSNVWYYIAFLIYALLCNGALAFLPSKLTGYKISSSKMISVWGSSLINISKLVVLLSNVLTLLVVLLL